MYVRGYLQGSENGRVVTIDIVYVIELSPFQYIVVSRELNPFPFKI